MKNILPLLSLLLAIPSQAEIISRNLVGTAADIRITKNYDIETETGEVVVKQCASCASYNLTITSETKISRDSTVIKPEMLQTYLDEKRSASMRLQFTKHTNHITFITLKRNNKEYPQ